MSEFDLRGGSEVFQISQKYLIWGGVMPDSDILLKFFRFSIMKASLCLFFSLDHGEIGEWA